MRFDANTLGRWYNETHRSIFEERGYSRATEVQSPRDAKKRQMATYRRVSRHDESYRGARAKTAFGTSDSEASARGLRGPDRLDRHPPATLGISELEPSPQGPSASHGSKRRTHRPTRPRTGDTRSGPSAHRREGHGGLSHRPPPGNPNPTQAQRIPTPTPWTDVMNHTPERATTIPRTSPSRFPAAESKLGRRQDEQAERASGGKAQVMPTGSNSPKESQPAESFGIRCRRPIPFSVASFPWPRGDGPWSGHKRSGKLGTKQRGTRVGH